MATCVHHDAYGLQKLVKYYFHKLYLYLERHAKWKVGYKKPSTCKSSQGYAVS